MSPDHEDPILDSCLGEVLAGKSPPDLTPRILHALAARGEAIDTEFVPEPPPILTPLPRVFDTNASLPLVTVRGPHRHQHRSSPTRTIAIAAGILGLGLAVAIVALVRFNDSPIARRDNDPPTKPIANTHQPDAQARDRAANSPDQPQPPAAPQLVHQPTEPSDTGPPPPVPSPSIAVAPAPLPRQYPPPSPHNQIVSFVNSELAQTWTDAGVKPTPAATDAQWCQRLFTRLLGRAPTAEEQQTFTDDKSATRREKLVDRLLDDPDFSDQFARHWANILTNVFLGKRPTPPGALASRDDLQKYFVTALSANKPYDQIVRDLLTATGSSRPGSDDYNPAVNFLLDGLTPDATTTTARVSRVLLGHQLQCAQCHQHPTHNWTPEQFWSLNACFRQIRAERSDGGARLVITTTATDPFYETPDGLVKTAQPRFIDGSRLGQDRAAIAGPPSALDPRHDLARLLTQSDAFAKATANRVWSLIYDYGFTRPVDDLGPHSTPADPQVLDRLASEFASHGFELKSLIRWTVLAEPFNRSATITDLASKDMPEEGEPALFSRYYSRPSQAPPAAGALAQAVRIRRTGGSASDIQKARIDWLTQANKAPTKLPGKRGTKAPAPAPSVMAKPGELRHHSVTGDPTGLVKKLAASSLPFEQKIDHLFLAALARLPSPPERRTSQDLLAATQNDHTSALEETWWALLNSTDCVLDR